ncbi:hypothetical protein Zm00014a_042101 [Zea mays]|uniref:Uncharacterized protein n=2 Tax=Zea mays TaxID=4577 RepID=A0A8J8XF99_MAIZE|nr:hypothetical protein ZEAMMB73_Zm00001d033312 [Zea mays]PWZ53936.1 hypothetical protein Zm00014a_042101 [Zea mays]
MAWRGAASRSIFAAVRARAASSSSSSAATRLRSAAPIAATPRRTVPAFAFAAARPLAAMAGYPAAVAVRLTGHSATSVRACCELSQALLLFHGQQPKNFAELNQEWVVA